MVFGNGTYRIPAEISARLYCSPLAKKVHQPYMLSPADLGLEPVRGFEKGNCCTLQSRCGFGFDAFGFSPCAQASPLVRLLGLEGIHSSRPVLSGRRDLCCHCVLSLSVKKKNEIQQAAMEGRIKFPTPTFAEALKKVPRKLPRFQELKH